MTYTMQLIFVSVHLVISNILIINMLRNIMYVAGLIREFYDKVRFPLCIAFGGYPVKLR